MKSLTISIFLHITILYTVVLMNSKRVSTETFGEKVTVNMVNIVSNKKTSGVIEKTAKKIKKGDSKKIIPKENITKKNPEPIKKKEKIHINEKKATKEITNEIKTSEIFKKPTEVEDLSQGRSHGNSHEGEIETVKIKNDENKISNSSDEIAEGFEKLSDGSIIAKNQGVSGLNYGFISNPDPRYPLIAKRLGFDGEVVVKVRMLINEDGSIGEIKFYSEKDKFGFTEEVEKTVKRWQLTPVTIGDKNVKMYLFKTFRFKLKS